MEFNNYYPTTDLAATPSSLPPLPYLSDVSFYALHSYSQPSQGYADREHEKEDTGALAAISDGLVGDSLDAFDRFLSGKKRFAANSVEDILGLIYERERIRYDQSHRIDYESAQAGERLLEIGTWRTGVNPQIDKTRGQLQREILNLERERRMEEVASWRDITRLKGDLREALRDFDQEKRKENLITQNGSP